jgi:hypothetical protein
MTVRVKDERGTARPILLLFALDLAFVFAFGFVFAFVFAFVKKLEFRIRFSFSCFYF